jgi:hypothetical protein
MQTSNYLPYAIDKAFSRVNYRGSRNVRFWKRYAHKQERQRNKEFMLTGRDRREHKHFVTSWHID